MIFEWTKYKIEINQTVQEVCKQLSNAFYCICHIFSCIFWQASLWKLYCKNRNLKKKQSKKIKSSNFAEWNVHCKTNACNSFDSETEFFCLALYLVNWCVIIFSSEISWQLISKFWFFDIPWFLFINFSFTDNELLLGLGEQPHSRAYSKVDINKK